MNKLLKTILFHHRSFIECLSQNANARSGYIQLRINAFKEANTLLKRFVRFQFLKFTQRVDHYKRFGQKVKDWKSDRYLPIIIAAAIPIKITQDNKKFKTFDKNDDSSINELSQWLFRNTPNNQEINEEMIIYNLEKSINTLKELNENDYTNNNKVNQLVNLNSELLVYLGSEELKEKYAQKLYEVYRKIIKYHLNQTNINEGFFCVLYAIKYYLNDDIIKALIQDDLVKPILSLITSSNIFTKDKLKDDDTLYFYFCIISFLKSQSKQKESREHLRKLNAIDYLIDNVKEINKVLEVRKELHYAKVNIIALIANLMNDGEMSDLPSQDDYVKTLCNGLSQCINNKERNQLIRNTRLYVSFKIKDKIYYKYASHYLNCLIKVASIDSIKTKIIDNSSDIIELLEKILLYGTTVEKELTVELLNSLCFSAVIVQKLKQKKTILTRLIENLKAVTESDKTERYCQQLIELLNLKLNDVANTEISDKQMKKNKIMISYQHTQKDKCHKLYKKLKEMNYDVWLDEEEVFNYLYAAMAKAVEEAPLIIVCYSEEYQRSKNCRLEANYACDLNKKLIFINVGDDDFKPNDWLDNERS